MSGMRGQMAAPVRAMIARVDGWWSGKRGALARYQAGYAQARGLYFQGLPSHTLAPSGDEGGDSVPDRASARPHYQGESWVDALPGEVSSPWPCLVQVDTYQASGGEQYYSATLRIRSNEASYQRLDIFRNGVWVDGEWEESVE